ncbi:MAG TPA: hypothetical protein DD416_15560 [Rhodobacteraceae bacterium]|jgi:indolepyruvate ferredoxin oxidoreductase, beta subunit|nr:indolepyruvate oxidoreductase subunit beta family protein [Rhodobacter sp.]HBN32591.1 hypothetical protein [Paracoccaceae bacterium]
MTAAFPGLSATAPDFRMNQIVKLAILAVGGQGGGVLNGWIVDLAERNGYEVQATSVAGVAQRTGATIYYVEMMPKSGRRPVFSLASSEGDVDILLAAELMEAGRAVIRGFVTPGRTRVIASTHRQLATIEKIVPGDGTSDAKAVMSAVEKLADTVIAFDMQRIADEEGTVISAALFGALAGSGTLPFEIDRYRETVRAFGRGVEKSLAAFDRACTIAQGKSDPSGEVGPVGIKANTRPKGPAKLLEQWAELERRVNSLPEPAQDMTFAGLRKIVGFQDLKYGREYLDRLEVLAAADAEAGGGVQNFAFTTAAAKYLANALTYDDVIRVADAKTRSGRFGRIEAEVGAENTNLVRVTEYTHPGASEIVSLFPARLGAWFETSPGLMRILDRVFNRGRRIRTDRVSGFLSLYVLAGLRGWRRALLRHRREIDHVDGWIAICQDRLSRDYLFAVETLCIRRLVKGYSDTHARGLSKFDRVIVGSATLDGRADAADWTRRLINAALQDEKGEALQGALATIKSFVGETVQ